MQILYSVVHSLVIWIVSLLSAISLVILFFLFMKRKSGPWYMPPGKADLTKDKKS